MLISLPGFSQSLNDRTAKPRTGEFYVYWGWNRDAFTKSDIHFTGEYYDFTLENVIAKDRQSPFEGNVYLNPGMATIPQYNFRVGYFLNDHYNVSFGIDHMKYVMQEYQIVKISGTIDSTYSQYDRSYENDDIILSNDFLLFEHTDGLNYVNFDIRRFDALFVWKHININITEGIGAGILFPRTNTTLLGGERYDEFHVSGFGVSGVVGLNFEFFNHFFIQTEMKGGFISMPDIRTTMDVADGASQTFFFGEMNIVFGANFRFGKYRLNQQQVEKN